MSSHMLQETLEAGVVCTRQRLENATLIRDLGTLLRKLRPRLVITCARGSSDHAASYAKYAIETRAKVMVSSYAPSMSSVYATSLHGLEGNLFLAISQSGKSPDILASIVAAKDAGAMVIACLNDEDSPAAGLADFVIPLHAGKETAVAATKSFIASLLVIAHLVAEWTEDRAADLALDAAAGQLETAVNEDWREALEVFESAQSTYTIGRGLTFGVANEAALKLKETSILHGEAFSAAEVRHGPMALVGQGFPVLMFPPNDPTIASFPQLAEEFSARGAHVFSASVPLNGARLLSGNHTAHPLIAPVLQIASFYRFADSLAHARGYNPDAPQWLTKVTQTR